MADTSSFDVTSTIDFAEVDNALNQARKEVGQRYDFKGAKADIDLNVAEKKLTLTTDDEMKMNALWEILQTRLVRRGVSTEPRLPAAEAAALSRFSLIHLPAIRSAPSRASTPVRPAVTRTSSKAHPRAPRASARFVSIRRDLMNSRHQCRFS